MYIFLLVGCGEIGSRHLQSLYNIDEKSKIYVFDNNLNSLNLGKKRIEEISKDKADHEIYFINQLDQIPSNIDLCIIATQAKGRLESIKKIYNLTKVKLFLIEKLVSRTVQEYEDILKFASSNNIKIWVNCKSRAFEIHNKLRLIHNKSFSDKLLFSCTAGNWGLVTNGIHALDLFLFYDQSETLELINIEINQESFKTKRNNIDISGSILAKSNKGSFFSLNFFKNSSMPDIYSISNHKFNCIIDHMDRSYFLSQESNNWQYEYNKINEDWLISGMTKKIVLEILNKKSSKLPLINEHFLAHKFLLDNFYSFYSKNNYLENGEMIIS